MLKLSEHVYSTLHEKKCVFFSIQHVVLVDHTHAVVHQALLLILWIGKNEMTKNFSLDVNKQLYVDGYKHAS